MRLSAWIACGVFLASTVLPVANAHASNPGPMSSNPGPMSSNPGPMAPMRLTTYCQFTIGPKAGTIENLRGTPIPAGAACTDGQGSSGVAVVVQ